MIGAEILDSVGADINKSYQNVRVSDPLPDLRYAALTSSLRRRIGTLSSLHAAWGTQKL